MRFALARRKPAPAPAEIATPPAPPCRPGPNAITWLHERMPVVADLHGASHRPVGVAAPPLAQALLPETDALAQSAPEARHEASATATLPNTPFLAFRGSGKPWDALALVLACRTLVAAHDTGRNRTPAIEAIRSALDSFR